MRPFVAAYILLLTSACAFESLRKPTQLQQTSILLATTTEIDTAARKDLEEFAISCNPELRFFDPLGLADKEVNPD
jgi:hypothetical protein